LTRLAVALGMIIEVKGGSSASSYSATLFGTSTLLRFRLGGCDSFSPFAMMVSWLQCPHGTLEQW
jgi:hypothetical protein